MDFLNYNSVETLPSFEARAAFTVNSASVFREDVRIVLASPIDMAILRQLGSMSNNLNQLAKKANEAGFKLVKWSLNRSARI